MKGDGEIETLRDRLHTLEGGSGVDGEEDLNRKISTVASYVVGVVDQADATLVSTVTVDEISKVLDQIDTRLASLSRASLQASARTANLKGLAETDIPKLVPLARQIPLVAEAEAATALSKLRRDAADVLAAIRADADSEVSNLRERLDEERVEAAAATTEQLDGVSSQIDSHRETLDGLESDSAKFKETLTTVESDASEAVDAATTDATTRFTELAERKENDLAAIAEKRGEIEELAGALGSHATAYDYIERADAEQTRADFWAGGGALLLLVTIVLGIVQVLNDGTPEVGPAIGRVALALVIGGAATYCFRMSRDHRETQRQYRVAGMQLAALPTFLAPLDEDARNEIRKQVVPIYFSGPEPVHDPPEPLSSDAIATLEKLVELLKDNT